MADQQPKYVVLGQQLAEARKVEQERLARGDSPPSPFSVDMKYDEWAGHYNLTATSRIPLDDKIADVCRRFAASSSDEQRRLRHAVSMDELYTLMNFAKRAAVLGMRYRDHAAFVDGFTAVAWIDPNRVDPRDIGLTHSVLQGCAAKVGENTVALFRTAATSADPAVAADLLRQAARAANGTIGGIAGHVIVDVDGVPTLFGSYYQNYRATYPLHRICLELAGLIDADQYQAEITLHAMLPRIWLAKVDDAALDRALQSVSATADVSGKLPPRADERFSSQLLLVFLAEMIDEGSSRTLLDLARRKLAIKPDTAMFALVAGRLFCLMVGRSVVQGVEPIENSRTIRRFEPPMEKILRAYA